MRIRDALESDAEALATVTDRPREVAINMIHDRSVRVAVPGDEREGDDGRESDDGESDGGEATANGIGRTETDLIGFVAFDVRNETVHVTDFDGEEPAIERLFEEPRRFARREGMGVEVVVPNDEATSDVIEAAGFRAAGRGPRFEERRTTRYRIESDELNGDR